MDSAEQIFATGGATGVTGIVLFLLYKFFFTHNRFRSSCCGKKIDIETGVDTPKPEIFNINPMVENGRKPETDRQDDKSDSSNQQSV